LFVGTGNLTYALILVVGAVVNKIPFDLVPFRYRITLLTASIWPFVGITVYFANMFVIVDISGRVEMDSQFKLPMNFCMNST
jgi:hypothetical protein